MIGLAQRLTDHLPAAEQRSQCDPDPALPRERLWQVRAKQVVIAAGAIERPLVFPGNDRPGVMLADAARTYAVRYRAAPGQRAVIATTSDTAYRAALDLQACGVEVALIADARPAADGPLPAAARAAGIRVETGMQVLATRGRRGVRVAIVGHVDAEGRVRGREWVRCSLARHERRLDALPAPVLAVARQAALRRGDGDLFAGRIRGGRSGPPARAAACTGWRTRCSTAPWPGARRRTTPGSTRHPQRGAGWKARRSPVGPLQSRPGASSAAPLSISRTT